MSVSFYPTMQDTFTQIACGCGDKVSNTLYASYVEAYNAVHLDFSAVTPVCGDDFCSAYPASFVELEETPEVNVSNVNAASIFDVLGIMVGESFDKRYAGSMTADEFLGRVLVADAVQLDDAGIPVTREGNMVNCGRPEGYLNARITELRIVAEYAVTHKLDVCWA